MATRSFIARYNKETEKYESIYCHWDGYPLGVGITLRDKYSHDDSVAALMKFGDISTLRDTPFETQKESFKVTRGENTPALTFEYESDMVEHYRKCWCEYGYIWQADEWTCLSLNTRNVNLYELEVANV